MPKATVITRKDVGQLFKKIREDRNLTQHSVAAALGYTSPQFISNIERGICNAPLMNNKKLTKIYGRKAMEQVIELQAEIYKQKLMKSL